MTVSGWGVDLTYNHPTSKHSATGAHAPGLDRNHFEAVELARDTPETKSPLLGGGEFLRELIRQAILAKL